MAVANGTGLKKETTAAIASLFSPTIVVPVIVFLIEKNPYVRFHSAQALVLFLLALISSMVLAITIILPGLIWIVWFIFWLVQTYKAWQGQEYEVPVVGNLTRSVIKKA